MLTAKPISRVMSVQQIRWVPWPSDAICLCRFEGPSRVPGPMSIHFLVFFSQDLTSLTTAYKIPLGHLSSITSMVALLTCHMCLWRESADRP